MSNMKKIYVGNLNYQTTEAGLTQLFAECGNIVSATVIMDKFSGRSKGFGFVEFDTADAAQNALKFDQSTLDGRQIRVNLAKEQVAGGGDRRPFSKPRREDHRERAHGDHDH